MATRLAEADHPRMVHEAGGHALVTPDSDAADDDERPTAARGIVAAVLLSAPFWALFAFTIWLLL